MRTGERVHPIAIGRAAPPRGFACGFTYLWLLFAIAIGGAGLAALGQRWQTAAQRDRETEMAFRAQQIADAIAHYRAHSPDGAPSSPKRLSELLDDRRSGVSRRHLRRLYTDPFTGAADWVLLTDEQGGIQGLRSAAQAPALLTRDIPTAAVPGRVLQVSDRVFMAGARRDTPASTVPLATSAASPAGSPPESQE